MAAATSGLGQSLTHALPHVFGVDSKHLDPTGVFQAEITVFYLSEKEADDLALVIGDESDRIRFGQLELYQVNPTRRHRSLNDGFLNEDHSFKIFFPKRADFQFYVYHCINQTE